MFWPFLRPSSGMSIQKSPKKNGSKFTFVTQLHRKCTTSTDTYSIFGLHFNVWFTIIRDGRQHISYAQ